MHRIRGAMKEIFKKISELLMQTPGKSCQDLLEKKKRIKLSHFKVANFTDSLVPECNQCCTDMLIRVVHGDEKRLKHYTNTKIAEWVNAVKCSFLADCDASQNYVCMFLFPFASMK